MAAKEDPASGPRTLSPPLLHHQRAQRSRSTAQVAAELCASIDPLAASIPLLQYTTNDFLYNLSSECPPSKNTEGFKHQLLRQWEHAKGRRPAVFNYELRQSMYKLLDGDYNLSLQLNIDRGTLKRKPQHFQYLRQPFQPLRFNFTKLRHAEYLFLLRCVDEPYTADRLDTHAWVVNASPLERGHALIVPAVNKCLPQVLTPIAVRIATDLMLVVEDPHFLVLFNSLLAEASVNHLHLHTLFWPYESGLGERRVDPLHIASVGSSPSGGDQPHHSYSHPHHHHHEVFVLRRPEWFIHALVFQLREASHLPAFVATVARCAEYLTDVRNQAHNLVMLRAPRLRLVDDMGGTTGRDDKVKVADQSLGSGEDKLGDGGLYVTAYLIPRQNQTGVRPTLNFNTAALEFAGFITIYNYRFFSSAEELSILRAMNEEAILPDELFESFVDELGEYLAAEPQAESTITTDVTADERDGGVVMEDQLRLHLSRTPSSLGDAGEENSFQRVGDREQDFSLTAPANTCCSTARSGTGGWLGLPMGVGGDGKERRRWSYGADFGGDGGDGADPHYCAPTPPPSLADGSLKVGLASRGSAKSLPGPCHTRSTLSCSAGGSGSMLAAATDATLSAEELTELSDRFHAVTAASPVAEHRHSAGSFGGGGSGDGPNRYPRYRSHSSNPIVDPRKGVFLPEEEKDLSLG